MKVAILELCSPNHSSLVENWVDYFSHYKKYDVKVLCCSETCKRLDVEVPITVVNDGSKLKLFKSIFKSLKDADIIVYNSIQTKFIFFTFLTFLLNKKRSVLVIHNVNAWLGKNRGPILKRFIKRACRKIIISNIEKLSFCSSSLMKQFTTTKKELLDNSMVMPFQLIVDSECSRYVTPSKKSEFLVVYPGIVSTKRKEYKAILEAFADLPNNFKLVLLGKLSEEGGGEIYNNFSKFENIKFFRGFVPNDVFEEYVTSADFLISDLRDGVFIRYDYMELYGLTKDTGVVHLSQKYNIPLIVNHSFHSMIKNTLHCTPFNGKEDLKDTLSRFHSSPEEYSLLKEKLSDSRKNVRIERVYDEIDEHFN